MSPEKICEILSQRFGGAMVSTSAAGSHPYVTVAVSGWLEVARFLRDDPQMGFNLLRCISGLDCVADNKLAAVYDLLSLRLPSNNLLNEYSTFAHEFAVRVEVDRDRPHIPSVAAIWPAADWHEREAYDLLGIIFDDHPDYVTDSSGTHPRRILCPDDWVGHPLRKDYLFPMSYHGIPGTTEYELTSPKH